LPTSKTKQDELAVNYGKDGFTLLTALHAPAAPLWPRNLPAVQVLRRVLVQNYTRTTAGNGHVRVKRRERDQHGGCRRPVGEAGGGSGWNGSSGSCCDRVGCPGLLLATWLSRRSVGSTDETVRQLGA
jgi:hypothetical protein